MNSFNGGNASLNVSSACSSRATCVAWMTRWRRLVRDYEQRIDVSKAMIHVAMGSLLLRRISH